MITKKQMYEWLNSAPDVSEIRERDGARYIPYHIIVEKLNKFYNVGLPEWGTANFQHFMYNAGGKFIVSGSVDVILPIYTENNQPHIRTLSGAATIVLSRASNPHIAATVKSLAIMNAVKPLGKQFGWGINGFETEVEPDYFPEDQLPIIQEKSFSNTKKMKPDNAIMKQYLKAVEDKDQIKIDQLTMMYDIKTD